MPRIEKYGRVWTIREEGTQEDFALDIEFACIRKGGEWFEGGKKLGLGLFHHYKAVATLLWPEEDHHRWSDLILKEILQNDITVLAGAKDSGKTHGMAKYGLVDYWVFPDETLIIISSDTMASLERRIWGDIKAMFVSAKARFPWLDGMVIDSKHCICTDDLDDEMVIARDMRKGIACFLPGSLVDTPTGKRKIEDIKEGDLVFNAIGAGTVTETFKRTADSICDVSLVDGRRFSCTPEHLIFTGDGWKKAVDLTISDVVLSAHETMSFMQETVRRRLSQQNILLGNLPNLWAGEKMRTVPENFQAVESKTGHNPHRKVLQHGLRGKVGICQAGFEAHKERKMPSLREEIYGPPSSRILHQEMPDASGDYPLQKLWKTVRVPKAQETASKIRFLQQKLQAEIKWQEIGRWESRCYGNGIDSCEGIQKLSPSSPRGNRKENRTRGESLLRFGHRISQNKTGRGNRRQLSQYGSAEKEGYFQNQRAYGTGVESVSLHNQTSEKQSPNSGEGYTVYNLEIAGHPSYSVNGCLVHNCVPCKTSSGGMTNISSYVGIKQKRKRYLADEFQFMPISMYDSLGNANSGNFKMVCAGNPIGQGDPLDIISEPKGGWDSFPEPEKTTVWDNEKFLKSRTVNLVGTDSPNFDIDQTLPIKFWYLTNRDSIAKTVAGYGKDSHQFYSQCKGVRRSNLTARRVITQEICRQFFTFDEINWDDGKTLKIGALDAAYGSIGGDRCMGGHIEFGKSVGGKIRILIHPPVLVPVSVKFKEQPEDQIAKWAKEYCGKNQIEPENFFYDSTGRGALGTSFARIWSALVNPVEFGGAATKRPVSADLYIFDEQEKRRRLKRCDEHYRKFVTELWWSVRLVIESDQMRGMTDEICREGCMREWKEVAGNKIEVETKLETKERMGRSPDIFDWLVTAVEGARRRGFQISKLNSAENSSPKSQEFLKKLALKVATQRKAHELVDV